MKKSFIILAALLIGCTKVADPRPEDKIIGVWANQKITCYCYEQDGWIDAGTGWKTLTFKTDGAGFINTNPFRYSISGSVLTIKMKSSADYTIEELTQDRLQISNTHKTNGYTYKTTNYLIRYE